MNDEDEKLSEEPAKEIKQMKKNKKLINKKIKIKTLKGGNYLEHKYLFNQRFKQRLNRPSRLKIINKLNNPVTKSLGSDKNIKTINISNTSLSNVSQKTLNAII